MIFVTSDLHWNHANVIAFCARPFKDVNHMNMALTDNWNATVKPSDLVIGLGDWAMGQKEHHASFRAKLNGTIYWVRGNHDRSKTFCIETIKFDKVFDSLKFKYKGKTFFCQHVPPVNSNDDFDVGLCGHVHSDWKSVVDDKGRKIINVGVDVWDMKPVPLDTILDLVQSV